MKRLTQAAFQKAKTFVLNQGSALDQRRFEYHFEAGFTADGANKVEPRKGFELREVRYSLRP